MTDDLPDLTVTLTAHIPAPAARPSSISLGDLAIQLSRITNPGPWRAADNFANAMGRVIAGARPRQDDPLIEPATPAHVLAHAYQLLIGDLQLCGCGVSGAAFDLVRDILNLAPFFENENWRKVDELAGNPAAAHIVLSTLERADLIEHGGSIGGSWLTDKGRYYQTALREVTDWDDLDEVGFPHDGQGCTDACWSVASC